MAGRIQAELFNNQFILKYWLAYLFKNYLKFIANASPGKFKTALTKWSQSHEGGGIK